MPTRPNILFIHTDQQRWDALGANGNDEIHTPNLDRLAQSGANFQRYFVQNPVCMPSRASYLSGQYPSQLGITHMGVTMPEDIDILPTYLENYGYTSANLGKLHFLPHANRDHRKRHPAYDFDELEISDEPGPYEDAYRAWVREQDPSALDDISVGLPPQRIAYDEMGLGPDHDISHPEERFPKRPIPFGADAELSHSAFVADRTLDFIERHRNREPFCAVAGFYSPHSPWVVPQRFLDLYDREDLSVPTFPPDVEEQRGPDTYSDEELRGAKHGYYAMISEVDYHVGRLLDHLEANGIADNTMIVFTSDHGEYLGDHLSYGKGWPGYEPISRVPCLIRWPAGFDGGLVIEDIVEAVDLLPTILSCAGMQIPPQIQGCSLRPYLEQTPDDYDGPNTALLETTKGRTLRTDQYRYIAQNDGREELYDLEADPGEYENLVDDPAYAETLSEHRHELLLRVQQAHRPRERDWHY